MTVWLVAILAGVAFALLQYGRLNAAARGALGLAAVARAGAVIILVAILFDAPAGRARLTARWVALDASESMRRGDSLLWQAVLDSVRRAAPESTFVFGDSVRPYHAGATASERASELRPAVERAIAGGHPLLVVTDGEVDDPFAVQGLPAGSRIAVVARRPGPDVATSALELPRAVVSGDTVVAHVTVVSSMTASAAGRIVLQLDGREIAVVAVDAMPAGAERQVDIRTVITGGPGGVVVRAIALVPGDVEHRNDTIATAIDLAKTPSAVFVSSSPDFDLRYALAVLRGSLSIPTRAFIRVAPGTWRVEGLLTPVTEREVRNALEEAPIAIFHGDTAVFGPPRSVSAGPLGLIVPTQAEGEWYAAGAPASPLSAALSGVAWDSLPPIAIGPDQLTGSWIGLEVRRGREGARRAVVAGTETPRRTVVVAASGLWRWRFRGGASSDAYAALWGSIFDWLAAERADRRAAFPDAAAFRAGAPIRWRRGSSADSVVAVTLRQSNDHSRVDSVTLRFGSAATVETSPLAAGLYEVSVRGGASILVVNPSLEWIPHAPTVRSGGVATGAVRGARPTVRRWSWLYAVMVLLLCGEWLIRRRVGLR